MKKWKTKPVLSLLLVLLLFAAINCSGESTEMISPFSAAETELSHAEIEEIPKEPMTHQLPETFLQKPIMYKRCLIPEAYYEDTQYITARGGEYRVSFNLNLGLLNVTTATVWLNVRTPNGKKVFEQVFNARSGKTSTSTFYLSYAKSSYYRCIIKVIVPPAIPRFNECFFNPPWSVGYWGLGFVP